MRYGYVVDGAVAEGPKALPKAWKNISNFHNLSEEELKNHGWLPWKLVEATGQVFEGSTVAIGASEIVETQKYRDKTEDELAADELNRIEEINARRRADYAAEADGLFFKWKRGEGTEAEWLNKVEEIKVRHLK